MNVLRRSRFLPSLFSSASHAEVFAKRTVFIHPGDDTPTLTSHDMLQSFVDATGGPRPFFCGIQANEHRKKLMEYVPRDRSELPPRKMSDSFFAARIPLKSDVGLRERYINAHGTLRVGRLFEELDLCAVHCCYKHILHPRSQDMPPPYSCVTVLVDNMQFSSTLIKTDEDIRISGHVSWVGKSSLEISMLVDQIQDNGQYKKLTEAIFVFVARDPMNQGAVLVNELVPQNEAEKAYIALGEERNQRRRTATQQSLTTSPPSGEESAIIHKLLTAGVKSESHLLQSDLHPFSGQACMMSDWTRSTLILCHPQNRNRFNKIFGGFIMRQAYEIAYATAFLYSKGRPKIVFVDDILFRKPVEIGSMAQFSASIGFVEGKFIHIPVVAEVLKPETNERSITNVFHFTFLSNSEEDPPMIKPESYLEAVRYLYARRHFKELCSQFGDPHLQ